MIMIKLATEISWERAKTLRIPGAIFVTRSGSSNIYAIKTTKHSKPRVFTALKENNLLTN